MNQVKQWAVILVVAGMMLVIVFWSTISPKPAPTPEATPEVMPIMEQGELPSQAREIIAKMEQNNSVLQEIVGTIGELEIPEEAKQQSFTEIGRRYQQVIIEGMQKGVQAYMVRVSVNENQTPEESLINQLNKANQLLEELVEEAKKLREKLIIVPKDKNQAAVPQRAAFYSQKISLSHKPT